jgi:RNA polymerase sigma-70 factor (ECF subfamily)
MEAVVIDKSPPGEPVGADPCGSPSFETSIDLLQRARAGERQALGRLLERHLPPFRAWASRRFPQWARDGLDTDDLVQETLLHTIEHVRGFEPRRDGALQAYMRQALRNRIRDAIRRAQRRGRPVTLDSKEPDDRPSPLEETLGKELLERYDAALARLDDREREAIVARVELRQGWDELAVVLGKPSANAVRMAVSRALRRLAQEMSRGS